MMFYQSELHRGSRNVLSWSKVKLSTSAVISLTFLVVSSFGCRWPGGTTDALDALYRIAVVIMCQRVCIALGKI